MFLAHLHIRLKYNGHCIKFLIFSQKNLNTNNLKQYKIEFIPEFTYSSDISKLPYREKILVIFKQSRLQLLN